jgi:di/tricarboxylate transporter
VDLEVVATLLVLAATVLALAREWVGPAAAFVGALVLLVLLGIMPADEAFLGFSNPATISIAGLFIVSRALRDHAGLDSLVDRLLGDGRGGPRRALIRLLPSVMGLSAVMNNIPLVATTAPIVRTWAYRRGIAATHLLIPLSFAAILGGMLTAIGTGPTLVVSGMLAAAGQEPFSFFTITAAGLPLAVVGASVILVWGPALLPDRRGPHERTASTDRDYAVRLNVVAGGPADGATISTAGLRELETTYLATVVRGGHELGPVSPATRLQASDELVFVGCVESVRDLLTHPGLVEAEQPQTRHLRGNGHGLYECVVGGSSSLVGATLKDTSFRGRYGGAVIAIHRAGERLPGKLGTIVLRAGDALLVLAEPSFLDRWQGRSDFAVVTSAGNGTRPASGPYRWITLGTLAAMVALAATGLLSVVLAVLLACSVLIGTRAIRFRRALDALDREVLLIVAGAIGLGAAVQRSGLSAVLGSAVESVSARTGSLVALAAVVVGTLVLTEMITNVAAAALMVPIAIDAAERVGAEPVGFAVAIAVAASSSFLTPIGYQTNTIVYGLGRYRFGDYWRLGLPIAVGAIAVILLVVPAVWG